MNRLLGLLLTWFTLFPLVLAQDVGMGSRTGTGGRFEAEYTLEIETPHIKWAKPFPGGPIKILAVPTVREGRTLVELAQRLSLDHTTVSIDPAWDTNKWTMSFGENYGARAERGDLTLIYSYLEEELTGPEKFEVILLPLHHGWEALTDASIKALQDRVRAGCGLVLIRPFGGEISPLKPVEAVEQGSRPYSVLEPTYEESKWRRVQDHYITRAIPVESFPFEHLENYQYVAAPDSQVLISTEAGQPVVAARNFGKGRVIAFGYRNAGLSWRMPAEASISCSDLYWEYFYAMLCRAIIFAAGREPVSKPDWSGPGTLWRLKKENGLVVQTGAGAVEPFQNLHPGRYFLERQLGTDWNVSVIDIAQPDRIIRLEATPKVLSENDSVTVEVEATARARVELLDGFGRLLGQGQVESASSPGRIEMAISRPLTHSGQLRCTVGTASKSIPIQFAASSRDWLDYEIILPWSGPGSYQPWTPSLDEQWRRLGITTLARPDRNFRVIASAHLRAFGIYWYRKAEYEKRKTAFLETGDKTQITRDVLLQDPEFEPKLEQQLRQRAEGVRELRPFAYYLADESSLTAYADAFDVDWSPEAIAEFRKWLRDEYKTLEALNDSWETSFKQWDQVVPKTTREAQQHGNFAPWSDHRVFMESAFIEAIKAAVRITREMDPGGRASFSGTQIPAPHNGCNWYEIDQIIDYLQPYSGGNQDSMHHLFNENLLLSGFTGYGLTGSAAHHQVWRRLFHGHSGASIFWHYTLLNPDLTFSEQGEALAEAFGRLQSGIARVFMNSSVIEDGVAIHFSMASIRGSWITDGEITPRVVSAQRTSKNFAELMKRRDDWVQELERQGVQFRFLATPQIEAGELDNYKVLILPYSIAISDREAAEIERFAARGGLVYLDEQAGRMDERCRWRKQPLWTERTKGFLSKPPGDVGVGRAIDVKGDFLTTVRSYGEGKLYGLLTDESKTVELPPTHLVRYDLVRGGIADSELQTSPAEPLVLLERPSEIARLSLSNDLQIRLTDTTGSGVDRSVVAVKVFSPGGKLVRYYSSNVDIKNGTARFEIPFAENDPDGEWVVKARDVVSGLEAETVIQRGTDSN